MKALKIIGLIILVLAAIFGIAAGGYALANSQNNQSNNTANTNDNDSNNSNNTTPAKTVTVTTCNADELSLTTAPSDQAGAGTLALNLVMTNTGTRSCTLVGYPGVSLVNDNGNQIGQPAARTTNSTENTITLATGNSVKATVYYSEEGNFDAGVCTDGATKLRVYPPNDTGYISVAQSEVTAWCPGFQTSPVFQ